MLVGIGSKKKPSDMVDMLLDCHERIRSFTALALRIAGAEGAADPEVAESAAKVRRYFTVALPKHVEDEEESVLPRLVGKDPEVDRALRQMEEEHGRHEAPLRRLIEICAELSSHPERLPSLRAELGEVAATLRDEFEPHLAAEEGIVFPAMRRHLSAQSQEEMVRELRRRRVGIT